jgi:hypothetical protein
MSNVIRFIDSLGIKEVPLDRDYLIGVHKNMFMDMHNCTKYSSMTETEFNTTMHPLSGNFDLVIHNRIIDYKTGKASSAAEVKKRMDMSSKQDYYEFQPMIYLSLLRDNSPPPYRFSLVYVTDNDIRSVTDEDFRISENIRDVILITQSMREFISDPDSPVKSRFAGKDYVKVLNGWSSFVNAVFDAGTDSCGSWMNDEGLISSITGILGMKNKNELGAVPKALKKIAAIVSSGMFDEGKEIIVPADTLERFLSLVDKDHDSASRQTYTEFPAAPRINCSQCKFFRVCTKDILELEAGDDDE